MKIHSKLKADLDYLQGYQNTKSKYLDNEHLIENYVLLPDDHHDVIVKHNRLVSMPHQTTHYAQTS